METQRLNKSKSGTHDRDHDWDEVHNQMLQVQKKTAGTSIQRSVDKVQRQNVKGDPWVKDHEGTKAYYYDTEAEALRRKAILVKIGAWEEYRVASFTSGSKTYWRVEMKGPKSSSGEGGDGTTDQETTTTDHRDETDNKSQSEETPAKHTFVLTFDDGPHVAALGAGKNYTENVLNTLKEKGVKGGFFVQTGLKHRGNSPIGKQLVKRMHTDGHIVGIHTGGTVVDHENHITTNKKGNLEKEMTDAKTYIKEQTGEETKYVRPTGGDYGDAESKVYDKLKLTNLLWDIDGDTGGSTLDHLKSNMLAGIKNMIAAKWKGETTSAPKIVVLYHDIREGTSKYIGAMIDYIKTKVKELTNNKDDADFDVP
ncbi:MAG TPA: polysaccharide deacetylase family protein, partial [Bacteroidia bacterium]|nr:polysaccharide deacetylase family protein [Bacteroidia bacterium]